MSVAFAFDRAFDDQRFTPTVEIDDPVRRLFVDHRLPGGARLLAMAEPVRRTAGGYLTAAAALVAFEEALAVAIDDGIEAGLARAFGAANTAVRAANHTAAVGQREFSGISAVVIAGEHAIIGCVPPGQALLLQDERLYGVPELASWSPVHMPREEGETPEPLGLAVFSRPLLRRTIIAAGDQVVLGSSAIGRVMARVQPTAAAGETAPPVVAEIEQALESSGVEGAYAAWVRVAPAAPSSAPVPAEHLAAIDRTWSERRALPNAPQATPLHSDSRPRRAVRFDRLHGRMIDASERLLGGRETESLPFDARQRAVAPLGASALERHVQRHHLSLGPSLRCRLPRGPRLPISKRSLLALFVVLMMIAGAALGYDVRQARADKQDRHLNAARIELQLADTARSDEAIERHLTAARNALMEALRNGADSEVIAQWLAQADAVEDRLNNVRRIEGIVQLGTLPGPLAGGEARLVQAGGQLFLIASGVYAVDHSNLRMVRVLAEGDDVGRVTVGRITGATADGQDLVVTDGRSLFRRSPDGRWASMRLASSASSEGWVSSASGMFKGSLYLLEIDASPQIKKFGANAFDRDPQNWLYDDAIQAIENGVDMVVDGSIFVLVQDGTIFQLHKGDISGKIDLDALGAESRFVGMDRGSATSALFVVEVGNAEGRLTRIEPSTGAVTHFLPSSRSQVDGTGAVLAFAEATDFVVDEVTGFVYVLTPSGLWRGSLS